MERNEQGFAIASGWAQFRSQQHGTVPGDRLKVYEGAPGVFSAKVEHKASSTDTSNSAGLPPLPALERQSSNGTRLGLATTKDASLINKAMMSLAELVFMGDSIIAGIPPYLQHRHFQNFGVSGSCVEDVLSLVSVHNPDTYRY